MAIESLLDALGTDADRDVRQVADAARAEALQIRAEAEGRVARRCSAALATREAELRTATDARRALARHEARADWLHAREVFLDRAFAAIEATLPRVLDAPENADALVRLLRDALQYVPSSPVLVRCRSGLADRLRDAAHALGVARVVADDTVPEGIVVEAEDGSVTIDNSLAGRLSWLRPALSIELIAQFERVP